MVTIQLLGGVCFRSDDTVLGGPPSQRHRVALLTLIVDAWPQPLPRDRALALLWPERDEASGRRLLNLAVHVLRMALGETTIASLGDGLLFSPALVRCDLHDLRIAISAGDASQVVKSLTGPLLDGFHLPDSVEFEQWLSARRADLGQAGVRALISVAEGCEQRGEMQGLVTACRRLVAIEPYSSAHVARLVRALGEAGERAAAVESAQDYSRRMRADLGMDPDPEVMALGEAMRAAPARESRLPSVAVLPFLSIGPSGDHADFADGMTEDVIAHLARVRTVTVISRTSVMVFRERGLPLWDIGRRLGASTVLDGSVRHHGDRVRIVATLIDVETDRPLWAETYDRDLKDIFAIQSDVALRIAAALRVELSSDERERVGTEPTTNLDAYRLFLQGRRHFLLYTLAGFRRAVGLFEGAVECDPSFAQAHTLLSMVNIHLAEHGFEPTPGRYERAETSITRALKLDPGLGDAHATSAYLKMAWHFDWAGSEAGFLRALELSPGSAYVQDLVARMLTALERYDDALRHARRAQELDPLVHRNDLTTLLLRAGRYQQALLQAQDSVEADPRGSRSHATLGWAYLLNGMASEGVDELERAVEIDPENGLWMGQLGQAYARVGDRRKAEAILLAMEERARQTFVSPYHVAYVHTGLGNFDRALELLEQTVTDRSGMPYALKGSFLFTPLRNHPRFQALLRTMNLS